MAKNIQIKIVHNNIPIIISSAIIVDRLKNYTEEWGSLSTLSRIEKIEEEAIRINEDPSMQIFNNKIGYLPVEVSLDRILEEVIELIEASDPKYVIDFHSYNDLEKVAIYFILRINYKRTISEIFELINNSYDDISKRDILIMLLSEIDYEGEEDFDTEPLNGIFRILHNIPTHDYSNLKFSWNPYNSKGDIELKEYTFPMYSYNVNKRFSPSFFREDPNNTNSLTTEIPYGNIRKYTEAFNNAWIEGYTYNDIASSINNINNEGYKTGSSILRDDLYNKYYGDVEPMDLLNNYKSIIYKTQNTNTPVGGNSSALLRRLETLFFDNSALVSNADNKNSFAPFTMLYSTHTSPLNRLAWFGAHITPNNSFDQYRAFLAYYVSDLNLWLTENNYISNLNYSEYVFDPDDSVIDLDNSHYKMLPMNSHIETKGYFSNLKFIESSIRRVLYPKLIEINEGLYKDILNKNELNESDYFNLFNVNNYKETYDKIFDSIVNNSFIFTDRNTDYAGLSINYENTPERVAITNNNRKIMKNSNNIYEFIINSFTYNKSNINPGNTFNNSRISSKNKGFWKTTDFPKEPDLLREDINNYNMINSYLTETDEFDLNNNIINTKISLKKINNPTSEIEYQLGDYYNEKGLIKDILDLYLKSEDGYEKVIYQDVHFFKVPIHHSTTVSKLNRKIRRTKRELLTDISNLRDFNIKGWTQADFTYGEKALLKEYIDEFKVIHNITNLTDYEITKEMIKEINFLIKYIDNIHSYTNPYFNNSVVYFPNWLDKGNAEDIKELLERSILEINRSTYDVEPIELERLRELVRYRSVDFKYIDNDVTNGKNSKLSLPSINRSFMGKMTVLLNQAKNTDAYKNKMEEFLIEYQGGSWQPVSNKLIEIRDILIDDVLINEVIDDLDLYSGIADRKKLVREFDIGLYKLMITNYFRYLTDNTIEYSNQITPLVFQDNENTGFIRYYHDITNLIQMLENYHKLIPKYVEYLNNFILVNYYDKIKAIKKLPTWDYESLHSRDKEKSLIESNGINVYDYNITWNPVPGYSNNLSIIQKWGGSPDAYRVTHNIYKGGLNVGPDNYIQRDRWWRKWTMSNIDKSESEWTRGDKNDYMLYDSNNVNLFKVPSVKFSDMNIEMPPAWNYNEPLGTVKISNLINSREISKDETGDIDIPYQMGKVGSLKNFDYVSKVNNNSVKNIYESIGVPLLVLDDLAYLDYNKPNTTRINSYSLENTYLNMWYPDDGNVPGGFEAPNNMGLNKDINGKYVSAIDKYKRFGLGNFDFQEIFRFIWNTDSSIMGTPTTVMNFDVFDDWVNQPGSISEYDYTKGHMPWANRYDYPMSLNFNYRIRPRYESGWWRQISFINPEHWSLFHDNISIPVAKLHNSFYFKGNQNLYNEEQKKNAIYDIFNRNFRNRVYVSLLDWRYLNKRANDFLSSTHGNLNLSNITEEVVSTNRGSGGGV